MIIPSPDALSVQEKTFFINLYFAKKPSSDSRYANRARYYRVLSGRYDLKIKTLSNNQDSLDPYFDNGRRGWYQRTMEKKNKFLATLFAKYRDISDADLDRLVMAIMETSEFFSVRINQPTIAQAILSGSNNFVMAGLNTLQDKLHLRQKVFIVLGESNDPTETWEPGLIALGHISKAPYELREGAYKIRVSIDLKLDKALNRVELVKYSNAFDIAGIGPMTRAEPLQAIDELTEDKALTLVRSLLDKYPAMEQELKLLFGGAFMAGVKNEEVYLLSRSQTWAEKLVDSITEEPEETDFTDHFEPDLERLASTMKMTEKPYTAAVNFINTGKHLILTGPPGTGKTTIATKLAEEAVRTGYNRGCITATATAEWSTFDTIGGYMPSPDGQLDFQEGIILRSIRENKWIILDEINRAEMDKAFGPLFTLLSGKAVDLPFKSGSRPVRLRVSEERRSWFDTAQCIYYAGANWRMIGTMNTYDKNSLFTLSYALMRRFAFIHIPVPPVTYIAALIDEYCTENNHQPPVHALNFVRGISQHSPRPLGPAIILDLLSYLKTSGFAGFNAGICGIVIPQLEGVAPSLIRKFFLAVKSYLPEDEATELEDYLTGFFELEQNYLTTSRGDEMPL